MREHADLMRKDRHFLQNILKDFKEEHANFRVTGMWTTAQQIRHVGRVVWWFWKGAFEGEWDMDFAREEAEISKPVTLAAAIRELDENYNELIMFLETASDATLGEVMANNPIFPAGTKKFIALAAITDHTAHHRGILSVYLRLNGIKPTMAYAD
ncbi:DinB family protein [Candidatus Sumerlaeota bacterium]|nr:DinB family protein [Candidatus Sumerlaeota bacterium]